MGFIILDTQFVRDRPLCCDRDFHLIHSGWGKCEWSVIDIRQAADCRKAAKLIEPRRRCGMVALGDQICSSPKIEIWKRGSEIGHERLNVAATPARFMQ